MKLYKAVTELSDYVCLVGYNTDMEFSGQPGINQKLARSSTLDMYV